MIEYVTEKKERRSEYVNDRESLLHLLKMHDALLRQQAMQCYRVYDIDIQIDLDLQAEKWFAHYYPLESLALPMPPAPRFIKEAFWNDIFTQDEYKEFLLWAETEGYIVDKKMYHHVSYNIDLRLRMFFVKKNKTSFP